MLANAETDNLDRGPGAKPGTERMCALTREVRPIRELIRFVVGPEGQVVPDLKHNLPGRGLWLTASRAVLTEAVKRKLFSRGFKREVAGTADLADETERLLRRSALDALGIAAKAGSVAAGFAKVEAALTAGSAAALIHAQEAAADGIRKLDAAARRASGPESAANEGDLAVINDFTGDELDLALGRSNVIHAAVLAGAASTTFVARCERLAQFRRTPDFRV